LFTASAKRKTLRVANAPFANYPDRMTTMTTPSAPASASAAATTSFSLDAAAQAAIVDRLTSKFGAGSRDRLAAGVARVARRWTSAEGDADAFEKFCATHFVADDAERTALLDRLERALELVHGHLYEMRRGLRWWSDVDVPDMKGVDDLLATFDPAPDLSEQLYRQRLGFVALLNLNRPELPEMLEKGGAWSVAEWAEVRIAHAFGPRIPAELNEMARMTGHAANQWVARFHIPVGNLRGTDGKAWYEGDRALLAHWLVREEIKAQYGHEDGLHRQRQLSWVMGRHIDGTVPKSIMERTATGAWDAEANTIDGASAKEFVGPERYRQWLSQRDVAFAFDPHYPEHPTAMDRKFGLAREIPQDQVERLLVELLESPVRRDLAALLKKRLGRDLEPFDIYFDDLSEGGDAGELNAAVRRRFADEKAFQAELPRVLTNLGFPETEARFLAERTIVEIARGSGHAMRPYLPQFSAWLRTNRLKDELGWDGFDTAMHELGHTLEQVISTCFVPRPSLRGVPNTACTEAFAFLYQSLARQVIGMQDAGDEPKVFGKDSVQSLLTACQIAGPSLLELRAWQWIYEHRDATPEAFRDATLAIADDLWSKYFEADYGPDPCRLLAAYQHMVAHPLYLADYTLGHIISHQIRSHMRGKDLASETRRICSIGRVTPDLWMRRAVGGPISVEPLLRDAAAGLKSMR